MKKTLQRLSLSLDLRRGQTALPAEHAAGVLNRDSIVQLHSPHSYKTDCPHREMKTPDPRQRVESSVGLLTQDTHKYFCS